MANNHQPLPHWVSEIQEYDVAIGVFETPISYGSPTNPDLPIPYFRTAILFFGFRKQILVIPGVEGNFDFSPIQTLKPTQSNWIPFSQVGDMVRTQGNVFVIKSQTLEKELQTVDFQAKSDEFKALYSSTRIHPPYEEMKIFHF